MAIINLRLSIIYLPMRELRCLTDICGRVYANLSAAFNMIFSLFPSCFYRQIKCSAVLFRREIKAFLQLKVSGFSVVMRISIHSYSK